jgi:hypothetical protein
MLSLEPPVFVVDVSNVSYYQTFVKKKVEKSLLFRFAFEFFDFVSPMVLSSISETASFFIKEPFHLDKWLCAAISGVATVTMVSFVSNAHYHAKLSTARYHILILTTARCGQSY